jgi:serine/threonine protein kinase
MLIFCIYLFLIFILNVNSLFNPPNEDVLSDEIANKIMNYLSEHKIPLILKEKLVGDEAGSMSSTYNGYLKVSNDSLISVIIKYSSFKSLWNYVHQDDLNHLYENGCYSKVNENTNEYLVLKQEKNRILNENFLPSEVYIAFKGYFCSSLMPTSTIVDPKYSYFSFFNSIEQNDDERTFFLILKKFENGISLKKYLEEYLNNLTIEITKYLIYSILISIIKLKNMLIIHLDLNLGNIFLMNNDNQHPIRFIDFAIMKFIHKSDQLNVMYSENLHQSLRAIFLNCPSCYYYQIPIFAQLFHQSFKTYSIEQLINDPWFYTNSF